mmetsp:Transcript_74132/g.103057  ORF Transcript_74132/g.103057 Transcript_74132/m.103057 type:complete len:195 (-) Transcript_74132:102-686(-)
MAPVEKISGVPHPLISTSIIKVVSLGLGFAAQHYHLEELLMEHVFQGSTVRAEATVVGVVVSCCYLAQYLAGAVAYARSNYGVPLPYMYPDTGNKEAQISKPAAYMAVVRGHENYMEFLPSLLAIVLCTALFIGEPATASVLGLVWVIARLLYAIGYASGNVNGRVPGFFLSLLAFFTLVGNGAYFFSKTWGVL